jgi:alkylation response protein AidB-like acyl-CoA dehydrogenase
MTARPHAAGLADVGVADTGAASISVATPPALSERIEALRAGGEPAIVATARKVAEQIAPSAAEYDRLAVYPEQSMRDIWSAGLAALTIPRELGGVGATITATVRAVEILSVADSAAALLLVWGYGQHRLLNAPGSRWPQHWRERVARSALERPALINGLRVEPELGTPARGGVPATTASRTTLPDGSPGWRINGHKIYCTGSYGLEWLPVWVATEPDDPDGLSVGTIVVPADAPGVEIIPTWNHLGMRASVGHDMTFTDVVVPLDNAVDLQPFDGTDLVMARLSDPLGIISAANLLSLAVYSGVAIAARDELVRFAQAYEPPDLGAPLATLDRVKEAVGEIETLLYENHRLVYGVARRIDERIRAYEETGNLPESGGGSIVGSDSAIVKHIVAVNAIRITELALSVAGGAGVSTELQLARHHRDALCGRVHIPQSDLILGGLGRAALSA